MAFNVQVNSRPENNIFLWPSNSPTVYGLNLGRFSFTGGGFTDEPDPLIYLLSKGRNTISNPKIQVDGLTIMIGTSVGTPYTGSELETEVLDRARNYRIYPR